MNNNFIFQFIHIADFSSKDLRKEFINSIFSNHFEPWDIVNESLLALRDRYYNLSKEETFFHPPETSDWSTLPENSNFKNKELVYKMIEECVLFQKFWKFIWLSVDEDSITYESIDKLITYEHFDSILQKLFSSLDEENYSKIIKNQIGVCLQVKNNSFLISNEDFQKLYEMKFLSKTDYSDNDCDSLFLASDNFEVLFKEHSKKSLKNKILGCKVEG